LVDDRPTRSRADAGRTELPVRGDSRQPLVDNPDWYRGHRDGNRTCIRQSCLRGSPAGAVQRKRQANNDLDRAALDDQRRDPAQVVATDSPVISAPHGLDRGRENSARIARGHSDANAAHVDPEPNSHPKLTDVGAGHGGGRLAHALATRC
jgi:hypothetical protein